MMKLINKLKKAFPKLRKGLSKDFNSCVIGIDAEELRLVYDRDLVAEKIAELGVTMNGKKVDINYDEAVDWIWWNLSVSDNYVIINFYYQGEK